MDTRDRERLLVSFILAAALYGVLFLVLKDASWSSGPLYPDRRGPVLVTIDRPPERPAAEPPKLEEPEPEPERRKQSKPLQPRPEVSPPETGGARQEAPEGEGGVPEAGEAVRSEGEGPALPEETVEEGIIEEEAPADIRGESRIIYADELPAPAEQPGATLPKDEAEPSGGFEFDGDNLDRALERPSGNAEGAPEEASGSADAGGKETPQPDHINIDFDTPGADRRLLHWQDPVLPEELISRIPPRTEVVVGFTISPEGYLSGLSVIRSSGSADVDAAVIKAMRLWRFEKVNNTNICVEARVRYVIQTM